MTKPRRFVPHNAPVASDSYQGLSTISQLHGREGSDCSPAAYCHVEAGAGPAGGEEALGRGARHGGFGLRRTGGTLRLSLSPRPLSLSPSLSLAPSLSLSFPLLLCLCRCLSLAPSITPPLSLLLALSASLAFPLSPERGMDVSAFDAQVWGGTLTRGALERGALVSWFEG